MAMPAAAEARKPVVAYIDETAASATFNQLRLYDTETAAEVAAPSVTVPLLGGRRRYALSHDGRYVTWVDASKKIHLLDRASGSEVGLARDPSPNSIDVYDDAGETPGSLTVSMDGRIGFDDNGNGPALVYASATNSFLDTGLGTGNTHRQTALSGNGGFLTTTCVATCETDQGSDSSMYVQNLASQSDTGFPDNLSGATTRDEEHPCLDGDGSRAAVDIPSPVKRDMYLYDRASSAAVALPAATNSASDDDFFCALDGDGAYLGYFRQTATDFIFRLLDVASGTFIAMPPGKVQSNPAWLTAPYTPPAPPPPPPPPSPFGPCGLAGGITCATVRVPLDRAGVLPGTVDLAVRRKPATPGPSSGVLVALTGGPGGAAVPRLAQRARDLAPALGTRDLVVFDQRGTGLSGFLTCGIAATGGPNAPRCANALGPARAFYRSRDSADDLEAVRVALGVDRLAISAVSYGAVVAYDYASRYPNRVEMLILDSPVPPEGFDWRQLSQAAAYKRVLRSLCVRGRCRGITRNPVTDMATVAAPLKRATRRGRVVLPNGRRANAAVVGSDLARAMQESDLNPPLRALLPSVLRSAAKRDFGPLFRLVELSQGSPGGSAGAEDAPSSAVNAATNCEEARFPWKRESPPNRDARLDDVTAALSKIPASAYAPLFNFAAVGGSIAAQCLQWPHTSRPALLATAPPPNVPALLLAGNHDVRTPAADTRALAGRFPRSAVVVAEETGHGVFGQPSPRACVQNALKRFLAGASAAATCSAKTGWPPLPLAPVSLRRVRAEPGLAGAPGRTLRAVRLTELDARYSWAAVATVTGKASNAVGGLRGGYLQGTTRKLRLRRVVLVPGVVVTGTLDLVKRTGRLQVSGSGARGTVKLTAKRVSGTLGGKRFSLRPRVLTASGAGASTQQITPSISHRLLVSSDSATSAPESASAR